MVESQEILCCLKERRLWETLTPTHDFENRISCMHNDNQYGETLDKFLQELPSKIEGYESTPIKIITVRCIRKPTISLPKNILSAGSRFNALMLKDYKFQYYLPVRGLNIKVMTQPICSSWYECEPKYRLCFQSIVTPVRSQTISHVWDFLDGKVVRKQEMKKKKVRTEKIVETIWQWPVLMHWRRSWRSRNIIPRPGRWAKFRNGEIGKNMP